MARGFDSGSSEYLQVDSSPVSALPVTMACWWYPTDTGVQSEYFFVGDKDHSANYLALGSRISGTFRMRVRRGINYIWGDTIAVDTWHHAGVVWVSTDADNAHLYTNGDKVTGTFGTSDDAITTSDPVSLQSLLP